MDESLILSDTTYFAATSLAPYVGDALQIFAYRSFAFGIDIPAAEACSEYLVVIDRCGGDSGVCVGWGGDTFSTTASIKHSTIEVHPGG